MELIRINDNKLKIMLSAEDARRLELTVEDATTYEELMVFTPVGIQSLYSLGDMKVSNIYATRLGEHLMALSREELAR